MGTGSWDWGFQAPSFHVILEDFLEEASMRCLQDAVRSRKSMAEARGDRWPRQGELGGRYGGHADLPAREAARVNHLPAALTLTLLPRPAAPHASPGGAMGCWARVASPCPPPGLALLCGPDSQPCALGSCLCPGHPWGLSHSRARPATLPTSCLGLGTDRPLEQVPKLESHISIHFRGHKRGIYLQPQTHISAFSP